MWKENLRHLLWRGQRFSFGVSYVVLTSAILTTLGNMAGKGSLEWSLMFAAFLAITTLNCILLINWTVRTPPRYPRSPLEHHQADVEREVESGWGVAIGWLRETIAEAEELSEAVIRCHRTRWRDENIEPALVQSVLVGMHAKVCDLSRVVADLCQRGHAEGAFMIWRSIFELEVNTRFIVLEETDGRARRFRDWANAAYLRQHEPESDELARLEERYKGWQIRRDHGWTRKEAPMGIRARAVAVGYASEPQGTEIPLLDIYGESNAYVHNDATAIFHDLGTNRPFDKGPSASGLDMPICLTARSVSIVCEVLASAQTGHDATELTPSLRIVEARSGLVALEVAHVPERLLSRFGGFDMSMVRPMEGGGELIIIPERRESTSESMERRARELSRRRQEGSRERTESSSKESEAG